MAEPIGFKQADSIVMPTEEHDATAVPLQHWVGEYDGKLCSIQCWKIDRTELEVISKTGRIWLLRFKDGTVGIRIHSPFPEESHG